LIISLKNKGNNKKKKLLKIYMFFRVVYFFFFGPRAGLANCESRGPIAGDFHGFSDHVWKPDPSHKMTHKRAGGGPCRFNQHVAETRMSTWC